VMSQTPTSGVLVARGSTVDLTVSSGPLQVQVPNVVGKSQTVAQTLITRVGLVVGAITQAPNDATPKGNVVSQDPAAGTSVAPGSAVNLVISSGPSLGPVAPGDASLVAHWTLDEASGTAACDSAGNNDGTLFGGPQWVAGKIGAALQFDGIDDYVDCGSGPSLDITKEITVAAWVKTVTCGVAERNTFMISKGGFSYMLQLAVQEPNRNLVEFVIHDGAWYPAGLPVTRPFNDDWHHLAGTYDGVQLRLYVDGRPEATTDHVGDIDSSAAHVNIGRVSDWPDNLFTGTIDDARIYNRALSNVEIEGLAAMLQPGLIGWWKLDETGGDIAYDSAGQNDGVAYGGPVWQPTGGKIGGAIKLDGVNDYVQLPIGSLISTLTDSTFATWVNWSGQGGYWQRIFDFGSGTASYMFLTPTGGTSLRFAITKAGGGGESILDGPSNLATGWHHIAIVIDGATKAMQLYLDGSIVRTATTQTLPKDLGNTTQNWLGQSQYADPYFNGSLDDFRIYNRALGAAEVAQLARENAGDPNLVGWWKLDETSGDIVYDSAAQNDGVAYGGPLWQPAGGKIGGAIKLDGVNDYVQLPIGSLISTLTDSTFATWVNWSGVGTWIRIFDFGSGTNAYMFLTPRTDTGVMCFGITNAGNAAEDRATAPQVLATGWHHVAVTIDAASKTYLLYLDGQVVATKTTARYTPSSLGTTTQNWLGWSQWKGAIYFNGLLDDFRIHNRVLSAAEVAQLATP
jgi:hypothetical protein